MDHGPSRSSVQGISQARILKWVAISFSSGFSQIRDWTWVSCIGRWILYHWASWEALLLLMQGHKSLKIPQSISGVKRYVPPELTCKWVKSVTCGIHVCSLFSHTSYPLSSIGLLLVLSGPSHRAWKRLILGGLSNVASYGWGSGYSSFWPSLSL